LPDFRTKIKVQSSFDLFNKMNRGTVINLSDARFVIIRARLPHNNQRGINCSYSRSIRQRGCSFSHNRIQRPVELSRCSNRHLAKRNTSTEWLPTHRSALSLSIYLPTYQHHLRLYCSLPTLLIHTQGTGLKSGASSFSLRLGPLHRLVQKRHP
jgi:hypothetical protein